VRRHFPLLAAALVLVACGPVGDDVPQPEVVESASGREATFLSPESLAWLVANQREDGSWSTDDAPPGSPADEVSATSLAVLAFLDRGYSHRSEAPFGTVVARGVRWLKAAQDEDGRFRPRDRDGSLRHDALATLALVESYGQTGSTLFRTAATRALAGLVASGAAGPPESGERRAFSMDAFGWAVDAHGRARSVAAWETKRGLAVAFQVDDAVLVPARTWLDSPEVTSADDPSTVATRILVRSSIGHGHVDLRALQGDVLRLSLQPVTPTPEEDLPAHVAAIAQAGSRRAGLEAIEVWRPRGRAWLEAAAHPQDETPLRGSYDERGPLSLRTGRVEATALGAMVEPWLCTAYLPRFPGTEPVPEPVSEPEDR
jgi:hypothetical protein